MHTVFFSSVDSELHDRDVMKFLDRFKLTNFLFWTSESQSRMHPRSPNRFCSKFSFRRLSRGDKNRNSEREAIYIHDELTRNWMTPSISQAVASLYSPADYIRGSAPSDLREAALKRLQAFLTLIDFWKGSGILNLCIALS